MSDLITIDETMKLLNVKTRRTIYGLVARGLIHSFKKPLGTGLGGRRLYFSRSEVEQFKAANETPQAAQIGEGGPEAMTQTEAKRARQAKRGGK